jgi:hypothetical protein
MLDMIDTLIGFAVVMLVVSAAVTVITQAVISMVNLRGTALRHGLAELLGLLDNGMSWRQAFALADELMRDKLVARRSLLTNKPTLATTIHREELTKLILDFAGRGDASKLTESARTLSATARNDIEALRGMLKKSLSENGIADPHRTLEQVRTRMLELERASPELANTVRANMALLEKASSDFLGKMNAWFDQTIDRVRDTFTARTRIITICAAVVVALFLQLDATAMLTRLSSDKEIRTEIVKAAIHDPQAFQPRTAPPANPNATPQSLVTGALDQLHNDPQLNSLVQDELVNPPHSWSEWKSGWVKRPAGTASQLFWEWVANIAWHVFGILLSAALLSLGGPFWYNALKNLIGLRSAIAARDDAERTARQTAQAPAPAS